jgi:hypothetical protein
MHVASRRYWYSLHFAETVGCPLGGASETRCFTRTGIQGRSRSVLADRNAPLGKLDFKQSPASALVGLVQIRGIADYAKSYSEPLKLLMALVGLVLVIAVRMSPY